MIMFATKLFVIGQYWGVTVGVKAIIRSSGPKKYRLRDNGFVERRLCSRVEIPRLSTLKKRERAGVRSKVRRKWLPHYKCLRQLGHCRLMFNWLIVTVLGILNSLFVSYTLDREVCSLQHSEISFSRPGLLWWGTYRRPCVMHTEGMEWPFIKLEYTPNSVWFWFPPMSPCLTSAESCRDDYIHLRSRKHHWSRSQQFAIFTHSKKNLVCWA